MTSLRVAATDDDLEARGRGVGTALQRLNTRLGYRVRSISVSVRREIG